jgi:hypothetical protein
MQENRVRLRMKAAKNETVAVERPAEKLADLVKIKCCAFLQ